VTDLAGLTVLVTRPQNQSEGLVRELAFLGASVYVMPAIQIQPPASTEPLDEALHDLDSYDWVILTSVNGVNAVEGRMAEIGIPIRKLIDRNLAAIGPATAAAMERVFRKPDLVPSEYVSEAIAAAFGENTVRSDSRGPIRFLLARADIARKDLADLLRAQGHEIDEVAAYSIVKSHGSAELPEKTPDYITLTSSSTARHTFEILKEGGREDWMRSSFLVCIGPITSTTVREMGLQVAAEAREYTVPGLVKALVEHAKKESYHA